MYQEGRRISAGDVVTMGMAVAMNMARIRVRVRVRDRNGCNPHSA